MLGRGICRFSLPYVDDVVICWPMGAYSVVFVFFSSPGLH
jgi:hypothetical protein